jgi:hypothetical protein
MTMMKMLESLELQTREKNILLRLAAIMCLALVLLQIAEWIIDFRAPCNRIAIDPTCDHDLLVGEQGRSL